jgi:hypothetical protein
VVHQDLTIVLQAHPITIKKFNHENMNWTDWLTTLRSDSDSTWYDWWYKGANTPVLSSHGPKENCFCINDILYIYHKNQMS